jgi:hypothetical protein
MHASQPVGHETMHASLFTNDFAVENPSLRNSSHTWQRSVWLLHKARCELTGQVRVD